MPNATIHARVAAALRANPNTTCDQILVALDVPKAWSSRTSFRKVLPLWVREARLGGALAGAKPLDAELEAVEISTGRPVPSALLIGASVSWIIFMLYWRVRLGGTSDVNFKIAVVTIPALFAVMVLVLHIAMRTHTVVLGREAVELRSLFRTKIIPWKSIASIGAKSTQSVVLRGEGTSGLAVIPSTLDLVAIALDVIQERAQTARASAVPIEAKVASIIPPYSTALELELLNGRSRPILRTSADAGA